MLRPRRLAPLVAGLLLASTVDAADGADVVRDSATDICDYWDGINVPVVVQEQ